MLENIFGKFIRNSFSGDVKDEILQEELFYGATAMMSKLANWRKLAIGDHFPESDAENIVDKH